MENKQWVMVPVKPTLEMIDAGCVPKGFTVDGYPNKHSLEDKWRAMVAAAPQAPDHIVDADKMVASDVQEEPVGIVRTVRSFPDDFEHTVHWLCKYKDIKDGDYLYTARSPQATGEEP